MTAQHFSRFWRRILVTAAGCLWLAIGQLVVSAQSPTPKPASDRDAVEKERQRLENLVREERRRLEEEIREKRKAELKMRTERLEANREARDRAANGQTTQTAPANAGAPSPPPPPPGGPPAPPAQPTPPAAAPPAGAPPAATAKFSPPVVLMLKPFNQVVQTGQRFATQIALYAEKSESFDRLDLNITYPQDLIRPIQIFDYPLHPDTGADTPATASIRGKSVLTYATEFPVPQKVQGEETLLYVVWEALHSSNQAPITLSGTGPESAIYNGNENLLDASILTSNASVNALVRIRSGSENKKDGLFAGSGRPMPASGRESSANGERGAVALSLRKPGEEPQSGEVFTIDVVLSNPRQVAFDDLRLLIGFDPERAKVLDWDYRNWITSGINIFDGQARKDFPFDILVRNEADNQAGRIHYQMGSTLLRAMPSGTVARIRVRALRWGAAESFALLASPGSERAGTDVSAEGASVLRKPTGRNGSSSSVTIASTGN